MKQAPLLIWERRPTLLEPIDRPSVRSNVGTRPREPHLLENDFLPGDLERQIEAFVEYYNHQRYHENLAT
jgi:hypothetical protein